ncbi:hypothetical protein FM036_07930 [Nostoc sp. HG1]|nr:hypothetical protein [Nostoc sp. HG1]
MGDIQIETVDDLFARFVHIRSDSQECSANRRRLQQLSIISYQLICPLGVRVPHKFEEEFRSQNSGVRIKTLSTRRSFALGASFSQRERLAPREKTRYRYAIDNSLTLRYPPVVQNSF